MPPVLRRQGPLPCTPSAWGLRVMRVRSTGERSPRQAPASRPRENHSLPGGSGFGAVSLRAWCGGLWAPSERWGAAPGAQTWGRGPLEADCREVGRGTGAGEGREERRRERVRRPALGEVWQDCGAAAQTGDLAKSFPPHFGSSTWRRFPSPDGAGKAPLRSKSNGKASALSLHLPLSLLFKYAVVVFKRTQSSGSRFK